MSGRNSASTPLPRRRRQSERAHGGGVQPAGFIESERQTVDQLLQNHQFPGL